MRAYRTKMFVRKGILVSSLQLKLISAHQGEIQYARAMFLKVFGSGENIGQTPHHTHFVSEVQQGLVVTASKGSSKVGHEHYVTEASSYRLLVRALHCFC